MKLKSLGNLELEKQISELFTLERKTTSQIIELLAEIFDRRMHLSYGYSSLFTFLTDYFKHPPATAQRWLDAVRMSRCNPAIYSGLQNGELNLSQVSILAKGLRENNREQRRIAMSSNSSWKSTDLTIQTNSTNRANPATQDNSKNHSTQDNSNHAASTIRANSTGEATPNIQLIVSKIRNQSVSETEQIVAQALNLAVKTQEKKRVQKDRSIRLEVTLSAEQVADLERVKQIFSHTHPSLSLAELIAFMAKKLIELKDPGRAVRKSKPSNRSSKRQSSRVRMNLADKFQKLSLSTKRKQVDLKLEAEAKADVFESRVDAKAESWAGETATKEEALELEGNAMETALQMDGDANGLVCELELRAEESTSKMEVRYKVPDSKVEFQNSDVKSEGEAADQIVNRENALHKNSVKLEVVGDRKPKSIPLSIRRQIFQRDQSCRWEEGGQICESKFQLQLDHIRPRWAGGLDEFKNLQLLCGAHNREKYRRESGIVKV